MIFSILLMIAGVIIFYVTLKDEKNKERVTVAYIMHLKGYLGGIGSFLIGLVMLIQKN